jgi:two-component system NtrC family sensor kinase
MRLVQKLSLAFILSTSTIIAVGGGVRAQRELGFLEFDRMRDHHLIGRALGAAIAAVWHSDGEKRALAVLEQSNVPNGRVHMRWIWLEGGPPEMHTAFDLAAVESTPVGETITRIVNDAAGEGMRYTYVPLAVDPRRRGALELSESLVGQQRYTHRVIMDTLWTTVVLVLVSAGLSTLLGVWIVGRPMRSLAEKARRVGQGDFTGPLHLSQKDELNDLAREMNTMCDRLVLAHERVEEETGKKISVQDQLRHADRLNTVGKLASGIAHELGTPLNVVSARAQMIADAETTPAETLDYARVIVQATERMTRIIRQLLEFARRKGTDKATCALGALARRTLDMLDPLAAKRSVRLVLRRDGRGDDATVADQDVLVDADASALEQVFTNLVVNAVQSMRHPGVVTVTVGEDRRAPPLFVGGEPSLYAHVHVRDEGEGIREEDLSHVFEPFFTTKDVGEGTGLGLSVAYGIVQDHGGWLSAESVIGKGSTFSVYLPVKVSGQVTEKAIVGA